jgi:hypothetical protein
MSNCDLSLVNSETSSEQQRGRVKTQDNRQLGKEKKAKK